MFPNVCRLWFLIWGTSIAPHCFICMLRLIFTFYQKKLQLLWFGYRTKLYYDFGNISINLSALNLTAYSLILLGHHFLFHPSHKKIQRRPEICPPDLNGHESLTPPANQQFISRSRTQTVVLPTEPGSVQRCLREASSLEVCLWSDWLPARQWPWRHMTWLPGLLSWTLKPL